MRKESSFWFHNKLSFFSLFVRSNECITKYADLSEIVLLIIP